MHKIIMIIGQNSLLPRSKASEGGMGGVNICEREEKRKYNYSDKERKEERRRETRENERERERGWREGWIMEREGER